MRYEYRTGEIRAALRAHGSLSRAARALGMTYTRLAQTCHDFDIPVPEWGWRWVQDLTPLDGRNELPGMIRRRSPVTWQAVVRVHQEHPDWDSTLIGNHLNCDSAYVRSTAKRKGIKLPLGYDRCPAPLRRGMT